MSQHVDYRLASVHGMLYTGGNVGFGPSSAAVGVSPVTPSSLISPVLNYLSVLDLQHGSTRTFSVCNSTLQAFDISPDGDLALCIGNRGLGVFFSFSSEVAIDTISIPPDVSVGCVKFSPDGTHVALALDTTLQVYECPAERIVGFHSCHRVEHIHNAMTLPITNIEWTADSQCMLVTGADARMSIFPRDSRQVKGQVAARNHLIGHRGGVVGGYWATPDGARVASVSTDNVVITWRRTKTTRSELMKSVVQARAVVASRETDGAKDDPNAVPRAFIEKQKRQRLRDTIEEEGLETYASKRVGKGSDKHLPDVIRLAYEVNKKHLLQHRGTVSRTAFHTGRGLLAIGYTNGVFAIHGITDDDVPLLHMLSISSQSLTACAFNATGDQVAFGSDHLKQLVVWDWQGESYILKEQSHYYDINVTSITRDGAVIVSGGEDGKVKVWKRSSGQCFASFSDHSAGVTGLACSATTNAFFTCSKDGTCRGYDLVRYRNFRVFTPSETTQLGCIAIDPSGELLAAGSSRSNVITLWSVRTGKIVDEFVGHQGPITALQFHPDGTCLVSAAVDKSIMVWKIFTTGDEGDRMRGESETIATDSEPLALGFSASGKRLAVLFLNGDVHLYDAAVSTEVEFISSFRTSADAAGGWHDNVGPNSANAMARFTTLSLSPDGDAVLLGGDSKWLCLYHAAQGYLLNKWPITNNLDFAGAEEQFNWRGMTEAGVMVGDIDVSNDDPHLQKRKLLEMPGSKHAHFATGKRKTKLAARTSHVVIAEHGRDFIAATTGGLLVFTLDTARSRFVPLQLRSNVTTATVRKMLEDGSHTAALIGALLLQDESLGFECMSSTPAQRIPISIPSVPTAAFATFIQWTAKYLMKSPAVEHALRWADAALIATEEPVFGHARTPAVATAIRLLHRAVATHRGLAQLADSNAFLVDYILAASKTASRVTSARHRGEPAAVSENVETARDDTASPVKASGGHADAADGEGSSKRKRKNKKKAEDASAATTSTA